MSPINIPKNDFGELRKKGEEVLPKKNKKIKKDSTHDYDHELSVYEIELKLQNEELRKTQAKLEQALVEYSELFEFAPICYFIMNEEGIIENVNEKGASKLGIDKRQLIGKHFSTFLPCETTQDDFYRHRNLIIETGRTQLLESKMKRKDGSIFYTLIESSLVKNKDGGFKHFHSMVSDISKRIEHEKKTEEAYNEIKQLNELKSRFIATASHEFRTPLTAILSSTNLIEMYNSNKNFDKSIKHFQRIKISVNTLKEILSEFLTLSQMENGAIKNNPETINIVKFIAETIEESSNDTHKIEFNHQGSQQIIYVDAKLLKTCLVNLIGNAIKYSKTTSDKIEITSECSDNDSFIISIKDYGIGIPKQDWPHIFEQFFRAKNAENIQGTGLGLNIIQKLIGVMGGQISFVSVENKGTTFTVKLPNRKHLI